MLTLLSTYLFHCRAKAWVCGPSLARIMGSNPAWVNGCLSLVSVVCCQVEVSETGRSFVQRSPTECGVFVCDLATSTVRLRPTGAVDPNKKKKYRAYQGDSVMP